MKPKFTVSVIPSMSLRALTNISTYSGAEVGNGGDQDLVAHHDLVPVFQLPRCTSSVVLPYPWPNCRSLSTSGSVISDELLASVLKPPDDARSRGATWLPRGSVLLRLESRMVEE